MTKHILFNIIKQKKVPIEFTLNEQRKFPVHAHFLTEVEKSVIVYKYKPDKNLDEEKYIEFLKNYFKKKYNAYSIEVGTLQEQLN
ncbi:hypothetical protein PL373_14565 [Tenacibaculum maritimum]|nr:hypothetical protein [Tenacibaculum maritimum]MDB0602342.1 hypothetical protein [Tenacibaculum maritimum]MDB0613497.1 hypothetical protein [Tenacibaculum maritimum]